MSCCPLTIHALLHIAPTIRFLGPVWTYWAFPMERHCGDIVRHIKSRRYPYININNYVISCAHLTQIRLLYDVEDALSFHAPISSQRSFTLPSCKCYSNVTANANRFLLDPSYVLTPPVRRAVILSDGAWKMLTATLSTRFNISTSTIRMLIPKDTCVVQYGRVQRLDGGDTIQARELIPPSTGSRDMSFVRVSFRIWLSHLLVVIHVISMSSTLTNWLTKSNVLLSLNYNSFSDRSFISS